MSKAAGAFVIDGRTIAPGSRATLAIEVSELYTHTPVTLLVQLVQL